jgi:hypothetical protein
MENEESEFLIPPLGADEVRFEFAAGLEAPLTDTAKAALETLVAELGDSDVSGFMMKGLADSCGIYICISKSVTPISLPIHPDAPPPPPLPRP